MKRRFSFRKRKNLHAVDVKTLVYPGFPTDLQQPFSVLMTQATGTSVMTDTIYSARFKQIDELRRMNANGSVDGRTAIITGPIKLKRQRSKQVIYVQEQRCYCRINSEGETEIQEIYHIERGYSSLLRNCKSWCRH